MFLSEFRAEDIAQEESRYEQEIRDLNEMIVTLQTSGQQLTNIDDGIIENEPAQHEYW